MKKYIVLYWIKEKEYQQVSVEAVEAVKESRRVITGLGSVMILEFILSD